VYLPRQLYSREVPQCTLRGVYVGLRACRILKLFTVKSKKKKRWRHLQDELYKKSSDLIHHKPDSNSTGAPVRMQDARDTGLAFVFTWLNLYHCYIVAIKLFGNLIERVQEFNRNISVIFSDITDYMNAC
jgi:hypothetical protein